MQFFYYSLIAGIAALLFSVFAAIVTLRKPEGTDKMKEISKAIKEGSAAYLKRQLVVILIFGIILGIVFYFLKNGAQIDLAFAVGAVASYATAYLGMNVAVRSNARTTKSAERGVRQAFFTAILAGSVTGFAAIGFALISLSLLLAYLTVSRIT